MAPLLSTRGLRKEFRTSAGGKLVLFPAFDGIDLEIFPGETIGLVGESGCGKTTLARCLLRLLEPSSGSIQFDGTDLRALSPAGLRRMRREFQIIFQDSFGSLDPRMTVSRILSEPFEVQGMGTRQERENWIRELMDAVGLDLSMADRSPGLLSGGQQQRVAIARALALKPRFLIADEPVSALDASVQAQVLNLLADLQRRYGLTLMLISHSLPVVRYLSSRVAVMYLGRIVEEAPSEDFFRSPKHPYSKALVASMPSLDPAARRERTRLKGEIPSPVSPPSGCHFHPRCPQVMDRCRCEYPRLISITEREKVACFLYSP
jgi:oligopeptide/dipeptide ABC transporter ATP-binding protein